MAEEDAQTMLSLIATPGAAGSDLVGQASARISEAGLGGLISSHDAAEHHQRALGWWENRGHSIIQIDPSEGASLIRIWLCRDGI